MDTTQRQIQGKTALPVDDVVEALRRGNCNPQQGGDGTWSSRCAFCGQGGSRFWANGSGTIIESGCQCPVDDQVREIEAYHGGGAHTGSQHRAATPGWKPCTTGHHLTDSGNGYRLIDAHGENIRHVTGQGWFTYGDGLWTQDEKRVDQMCHRVAVSIYQEAADEKDDAQRQLLSKWARVSEAVAKRRSMKDSAYCDPQVSAEMIDFDADPLLLGVENGVVDLRTGELRDHRRDDLITRRAPVEYDPDAHSDMWMRFLDDATGGDEELQAFLQRAVGYSLTGLTRDEVLFFVHGPAASGKSTFMDAVKAAFGTYATTANFETFCDASRSAGGANEDIARLAGKRLVTSIEVAEGKRLAEGVVKMLTGGDMVAARLLYQKTFEYRPQFTLWLVANHEPGVSADDDAMWRRIIKVPFDHVVAEADRDPRVKAELLDVARSGAAILAWAVRGCIEWQRDGLQVPDRVRQATQAYRSDQDVMAQFIAERCEVAAALSTPGNKLYQAYKKWCDDENEHPITGTMFGRRMNDRGFKIHRDGSGKHRLGIAVRS